MSDFSMDEAYEKLMKLINQIDVELDSLTGSKAGSKRTLVSELVTKHDGVYSDPVSTIVANLNEMEAEKQAAAYFAFVGALDSNFKKAAEAYVEGKLENMPTPEPMISPEEAEKRSKQRSELYQQVKSIVELVKNLQGEEWPMPKMRRGSKGPRGKRNLSLFDFMIDGEEVDKTYGEIAKENGYEKASEFTKALKEFTFTDDEGETYKFNPTTDAYFDNFPLPNGKLLSGARPDDEDDDEEESEENED